MNHDSTTYFASAKKATDAELNQAIQLTQENAVLSSVLQVVSGLVAILNSQRQIVSINDSFLKHLGLEDLRPVLGLRPGEAIGCVHVESNPNGCGTGKICRSCGAAISIVSTLVNSTPVERVCAARVKHGESTNDLYLKVRAEKIVVADKTFVLLFLQDFTKENRRRSIERIFFHDVANRLQLLLSCSELMEKRDNTKADMKMLRQNIYQLCREIDAQKVITYAEQDDYPLSLSPIFIKKIMTELSKQFSSVSGSPHIHFEYETTMDNSSDFINTDLTIIMRVVTNMIQNAVEASKVEEPVRVIAKHNEEGVTFSVYNKQAIPEDIQPRIFQEHFTTKSGIGHGLGTYSMKLLGEHILGGKVSFASTPETGTVFNFFIPDQTAIKTSPSEA